MTTMCDRFEREGLLRHETGAPPDIHEAECETCRSERDVYLTIQAALKSLPAIAPPAGWQERVLSSVAADTRQTGRGARWVLGAAAVAAAAVVVWHVRTPSVGPLAVRQEVVATDASRRSDSAAVGDTIRALATGGEGQAREIRLYRNERHLVARCPATESECLVDGKTTELRVKLSAPGRYRSLAIVGPAPIPTPGHSLDDDARDASKAGASVEISAAIDVE
jgi:hypothetical protein